MVMNAIAGFRRVSCRRFTVDISFRLFETDNRRRLVSATKYVNYGDRGFWAYDIVLGVFVKYLIDAIEATGCSRAPFLDKALGSWRLAPLMDIGFPLEKSWTPLQRQNVLNFVEEACAKLATRDSIPME